MQEKGLKDNITPIGLTGERSVRVDQHAGSRMQPYGRLLAGLGVLAMGGGAAMGMLFDPAKSNLFPVCPLFTLTGIACPGCGLTRGFHSLLQGDIIPALDFNFLIPVWTVILLWVFLSLALTALRGRGLPMWPTYPRFLWGFLIVLVGFGVLRNIPLWPLTILYP